MSALAELNRVMNVHNDDVPHLVVVGDTTARITAVVRDARRRPDQGTDAWWMVLNAVFPCPGHTRRSVPFTLGSVAASAVLCAAGVPNGPWRQPYREHALPEVDGTLVWLVCPVLPPGPEWVRRPGSRTTARPTPWALCVGGGVVPDVRVVVPTFGGPVGDGEVAGLASLAMLQREGGT